MLVLNSSIITNEVAKILFIGVFVLCIISIVLICCFFRAYSNNRKLKKLLKEKNESINKLNERLKSINSIDTDSVLDENRRLESEMNEQSKIIENFKKVLKEKDNYITDLNKGLNDYNISYREQNELLKEKDKKIDELNKKIEDINNSNSTIVNLTKIENRYLRKQINSLERIINEKKAIIDMLITLIPGEEKIKVEEVVKKRKPQVSLSTDFSNLDIIDLQNTAEKLNVEKYETQNAEDLEKSIKIKLLNTKSKKDSYHDSDETLIDEYLELYKSILAKEQDVEKTDEVFVAEVYKRYLNKELTEIDFLNIIYLNTKEYLNWAISKTSKKVQRDSLRGFYRKAKELNISDNEILELLFKKDKSLER